MADDSRNQPLAATEFTPLDPVRAGRRLALPPLYLGLGALVLMAAALLLYLFAARAVIFRLDPPHAAIDASGLAFHIGDNFLLLPGERRVRVTAEGYVPLEKDITVSAERTQEFALALEPLPGRLDVRSELDGIEVLVDGRPAGTAPGVIEDVARGSRVVTFRKHRYFPLERAVEVEGLGTTQQLEVELHPAWGTMNFSSEPPGAELYLDGELIGKTPLSTEVLETGSALRVTANGFKPWEKTVTVKAGTTAEHPLIELIVADGTLAISSSPGGANVSVDGEFRGVTPLNTPIAPLRTHRVELFLEGHRKAVREARVEPEGRTALDVRLEPIIGRIELTITPADAEVLIDGNPKGRGSQVLELIAREHALTVRKPGYTAQELKITPRPDIAQALSISLLSAEQSYWATRPPRIQSPAGSELLIFRPEVTFTLGAPRREPGRRANEVERQVRLTRPFYAGTREISNAEFRRWKTEHSSGAIQGRTLDMDNQPAVQVSWQQAALYCNWLSRQEGLPVFYREEQGQVAGFDAQSHGYRLPTEAEWAWLARIRTDGGKLMFPWGSELYPPPQVVENYADQSAAALLGFTLSGYDDGYPVSAPVGRFQPNHHGLYDMGGNVAEWAHDYYEVRPSTGAPELDPLGPELGDRHVVRGAAWTRASRSELRLSYRDSGAEGAMDIGFRIARYVDRPGAAQ